MDGDRDHNNVFLDAYRRTINGNRVLVVVMGGIPNASLDRIAMDNNGQWHRAMIPTTQQNNVVTANDGRFGVAIIRTLIVCWLCQSEGKKQPKKKELVLVKIWSQQRTKRTKIPNVSHHPQSIDKKEPHLQCSKNDTVYHAE